MENSKAVFLRTQFVPLLKQIPSDTLPHWGKMSLQQMVEHFSDSVKIASGKSLRTDIITPSENLPKFREFMLSEKPFRENTPNPLMPEMPGPVRNKTIQAALEELDQEICFFFAVFEENHLQQTRNPFFGDLNFDENVHLLYKHALHHLKQFGVMVDG
jgi:hypothetical protein